MPDLTLQAACTNCPLTEVLLDLDLQFRHAGQIDGWKSPHQLSSEPVCNELRRGVGHRQQPTIFTRQNPPPVFEPDLDLTRPRLDPNLWMLGGKQQRMVELRHDRLSRVAQGDEIEYIMVFIQWPGQLHSDSPVVPMQTFANMAGECDEVGRTKDQVIFGDPHAVKRQLRHFERGGATGVGTLTTDWEAYRERPATGCQGAAKDKNTCPAESLSSLLCRSFLLSNQEVSIQKFVNQFLTLRELLFRRELSGNGL